jgi:integrase
MRGRRRSAPHRRPGLRHTWATLALRAGVPIKVVAERIGDDATARQDHRRNMFGDE